MTSTATSTGGGWNPEQYGRFRDERSQPFYDLAALVQPHDGAGGAGMRVIDLGCGTGELTAWLHRSLGAAETLGLDTSEAMLAAAQPHAGEGLRFETGDVSTLDAAQAGRYDLVFSNATLHWVTGHETLIPRLLSMVRPGGQIAIQAPANRLQPSHTLDAEVAREEPFATALHGWVREDPVLEPEWYAALFHAHGIIEQRARYEVYGHVLPSTRSVVDWVKGALLTAYQQRLSDEQYAAFVARYEQRLVEALGEQQPYFYPFRRLFLWARVPGE